MASYEALMNEISVYMCCPKKHFFLQFRQVFEDKVHLYVLFDYWQGDQLSKLLNVFPFTQ